MAKRFPSRTAIAGLTALAMTAPIIAPANTTTLAAAIAQVREDNSTENKLSFTARTGTTADNPTSVKINTDGTFAVKVPNADGGSVQFYLDNIKVGEPVEVNRDGFAVANIKPVSYTNETWKHTVTARYVDARGFNPRADVSHSFSTPMQIITPIFTGRADGETYKFGINGAPGAPGANGTLASPKQLAQEEQFTLTGDMTVSRGLGGTNVFELGINPQEGTTYVNGERTDRAYYLASRGNGTGTYTRITNNADADWGLNGHPSVTSGFFGLKFQSENMAGLTDGNQTAKIVGTFKAPSTPGIYVPQFAAFKYTTNNSRYLHRMDTSVYQVKTPTIEDRNLRTEVKVELASDQKLQATVDGTLTAQVSPNASGTVTFIHPGSNGKADKVLGTAGVVNGEAKLHPVKFDTRGEQDIKLKFTPAPGTNWTESEGTGTVFVDYAPAKKTNVTLTMPGETVQGVEFEARATVDEKVDGTIQFYSVETDEEGNKKDVKYGDPIDVNAGNEWTATVRPKLFKLGQQTAKAVFTPKDLNVYEKSEKTQDIYIKQPSTSVKLAADEGKKVGEDVTITATIDPAVGGTIVFTDGDKELATETVAAGTSEVTITKSFNTSGSHALKAVFTPTDNVTYPTADDSTSLVIGDRNKIDTTLELTADKAELTVGESAIVTAKVPEGVEGRVMFDDGTGVQAFAPVDKATGEAKSTYIPRTDGKKTVRAEFVPINASAATHNGTTKSVDINVKPASTVKQDTNLVLTGPKTVTEGDDIVLTAFVNPKGAAGTVQFSNGTEPIGDPVRINNGKAVITVPDAVVGELQFSATYNPEGDFNATLPATHSVEVKAKPAPVTQTVTATATTTATEPTTITNSITQTVTTTPPTVTSTKTEQAEPVTTTTTTTLEKTVTTTTTEQAEPITTTTTETVEKPTTITTTPPTVTSTTTEQAEPVTKTETVEKTSTVTTTETVGNPATVTEKQTETTTEHADPVTTTQTVEKTTTVTTTETQGAKPVTTTATVDKPTTVTEKETETKVATTTVDKPTTVTATATETKAGQAPAPVTVTTTVNGDPNAPVIPPAPAVDSSKAVDTKNGREITLTASVTPGTKGEVVFETQDGTVIGKAPIGRDGTAKLNHTFDKPGVYEVRSYVQSADGAKGDKSATFTVTVADRPSISAGSSEGSSTKIDAKIGWTIGGVILAFLLGGATVGLLGNSAVKAVLARFGIRY